MSRPKPYSPAIPLTPISVSTSITSRTHTPHPKDRGLHAWLQVLGAFVLNFTTWGLLSSFGVFQTYYTTTLLPGTSASDISWIGSTQAFCMFGVSFLIGPLFDRGCVVGLLWTGSAMMVAGFFMVGQCVAFWQFMIVQGAVMGVGFGCVYLCAPGLIAVWFERKQALAMGIASSGSGLGAVVFPLTFTYLVPKIGFAWTIRAIAFIVLGLSVIPLLVMREYLPPRVSGPNRFTLVKYLRSLIDFTALRETPFLLLVSGLASTFMGIYTVLYYVNVYAALISTGTLTPTPLAAQTLTIINAASTIGRLLPSFLADKAGVPLVLALTAFFSATITYALYLVLDTTSLVAWSIFFGSTAGAFMGLPVAGIVSISSNGARGKIGTRIGMTLGVVGAGVLVAEPIAGRILKKKDNHWDFFAFVLFAGGLMSIGTISIGMAMLVKWKRANRGY
ncbi:monocarboxylate permease-like protein [Dendryphion nanum]|uniref:Monocarboxylate permease-like protein n=1 Tax=Dendryphion nanum TaxID=256645 RepID=A0A9P9DQK5_9PLEO|nr:monocarboxylate permease-like protein [Dendryphion nanum]